MKTYTAQINKTKAVCSLDDSAREQFCYNLDSRLDLKATRSGDGNATVRWLLQALQNNALNLSNELYQRLLVASRLVK